VQFVRRNDFETINNSSKDTTSSIIIRVLKLEKRRHDVLQKRGLAAKGGRAKCRARLPVDESSSLCVQDDQQLKKMKKPARACTQAIWPPSGGLCFGVVVLVIMAAVWLSRSASSNLSFSVGPLSRCSDVLKVLRARGAYNVSPGVQDGRLQVPEDTLVPACRR